MRELVAQCSRCAALCCVALPFTRSADFGYDKPAGTPCRHLAGRSCSIHAQLAERGFRGCVAYDCFGAGQHVTNHVYGGRPPRDGTALVTFRIVQQLHEMLWYLTEVSDDPEVVRSLEQIVTMSDDVDAIDAVDVGALRDSVGQVLARISAARRDPAAAQHRHADLAGADLRATALRDADLRGAVLIAADLRDVDLGHADLLGADLRAARLQGARLHDTLFLTRAQLGAALVDDRTTIPGRLR